MTKLVLRVATEPGVTGPRVPLASQLHSGVQAGELVRSSRAGAPLSYEFRAGLRGDVDQDDALDTLRVLMSIQEAVPPTHGRADQDGLLDTQGVHEGGQILHKPFALVAALRPLAVAVAPLVQGQDVVTGRHELGELVPDVGLPPVIVEANKERLAGGSPVQVV